ncbi:DUF572-domain-containing protein [Lophiostoma macrostomum CBS 122681]|uniref:DUF572-domain-containing protein n=1 Tax=Lophiostoma macrostomum CBS 122681 TaxID=1314788 RepID=A0A6A6SVC2_9PLEO|nr:DUF572-domain-containing protein [Lophiostoma macrostomum CBS 122681]
MQGFNMGRYYPPDSDAPPSFNTTSHPLGARAKKINQGILTVRFELPFAVWCTNCSPEAIVGQGVRFNAEKKKVGNYYSTPIWAFRMKHSACGGWWEIRTDPKNTAYVVMEGARKRDYGPDEVQKGEGEMAFLSEGERERRRDDAFAGLEGKLEEKGQERRNKERVEELYDRAMVWEDPYSRNAELRKAFRVKRKGWEREDRVKEGLQDKFSFGYEVVDEVQEDGLMASLVEFGDNVGGGGADEASRKPLFPTKSLDMERKEVPKAKKLKAEILAEKSRQNLQQTLVGNTRVAFDPFLSENARGSSKSTFGMLKRKRAPDGEDNHEGHRPGPKLTSTMALVEYDSD